MTFSESDLTALKEAYLTGALSISSNGRTVTFRSLAELKSIIAEVEANLAIQEDPDTALPSNRITATWSKY